MLQDKIVQTFQMADDQQKAVMIGTMPAELLTVGSDVYSALGDANEVWLAYLYRVREDGLRGMPNADQQNHILPLIEYDESPKTIVILMKAGVLADEAIDALRYRTKYPNDGFRLRDYTDGLQEIKERALPFVMVMMETDDPYELQYAFHAFRVQQWNRGDELRQLSDAVYAVLQKADEKFILSHCASVLKVTNPDQLLEFAITSMDNFDGRSFIDHPLREAQKHVSEAFSYSTTLVIRQRFVIASIKAGLPWFDMSRWQAMVIICKMGDDTLREVMTTTSSYTLQSLGGAIRFIRDYPADEIQLVVEVTTRVVRDLLTNGHPVSELEGFLTQAMNTFALSDYMDFVMIAQEQGADVAELVQYQYYDECDPNQIVGYMNRLHGAAKTTTALMALRKIKEARRGYSRYADAFHAVMQVVVEAYTTVGLPIQKRSDEVVQEVPLKQWSEYLDTILRDGKPYWAVRFAVFALKSDENYALANETLARMMLVNVDDVQWVIRRYLND